jgi:hypothetical protein
MLNDRSRMDHGLKITLPPPPMAAGAVQLRVAEHDPFHGRLECPDIRKATAAEGGRDLQYVLMS